MKLNVDLTDLCKATSKMFDRPTPTLEQAYQAGEDARENGSNYTNCHYLFFSTDELSVEWHRGNKGS